MTLGERLNTYLSQTDQKQSAVATEWLERYKKQNPKARWEADTIISHLNRCLKEKREGVRFFFEHDALRTDLLFELLHVPQTEHAGLRTLARECLEKEGEVSCRLVIDATTWGASRQQCEPLFDALKLSVLQVAEKLKLTPVVLVFTEEQFDFLPRSYDRLGEWLLREEVKDGQEAWGRIAKLSGDGALVLSSRQFSPMERWLAMSTSGTSISLEPVDGLDVFAKTSRLPAPPAIIAHDLTQIASPSAKSQAQIPSIPTDRRRMMMALADEKASAALKLPASERLAIAEALGVRAASTERERVEHELGLLCKQIGMDPTGSTQAELDQILQRAQRREVEQSFFRVGDQLHILNPSPKTTLPNSPRLSIHRKQSKPPAINRLMSVIDRWTADDYAEDRGLMRVIERLDPKGEERLAFLHARACLLWSNGLCQPTPVTPLPDWKAGLAKLLSGDPPAAQLRLFVDAKARTLDKNLGHVIEPFVALQSDLDKVWPGCVPASMKAINHSVAKLLYVLPVRGPLLAQRDQAVCLLDPEHDVQRDHSQYIERKSQADYYSVESVRQNYKWYQIDHGTAHSREVEQRLLGLPPVLLPQSWTFLRKSDLWLDLFDCSSALSGANPDPASWTRIRSEIVQGRLYPIENVGLASNGVRYPNAIWTEADQELALCWLALKNALSQGNAVRLHDGVVLLSMGAGLFARINIRQCVTVEESSAAEQQVRACLDASVQHYIAKTQDKEERLWVVSLARDQVTTHRATTTGYENIAATTTLGYDLPKLFLAGQGLRAEIRFTTSPLFLSSGGTMPQVAALAAAGTQALATAQSDDQRRVEEQRRAAYYADDDDDD